MKRNGTHCFLSSLSNIVDFRDPNDVMLNEEEEEGATIRFWELGFVN